MPLPVEGGFFKTNPGDIVRCQGGNMPDRGTYGFELKLNGNLADNPANLERLRALFRDGSIIGGSFGPGNQGDFDNGSWHILCHLAGGAGVLSRDGARAWVGITHKGSPDEYEATVAYRDSGGLRKLPLASQAGQAFLQTSVVLGYIEGSSCGHILAREANDSVQIFNTWRRQDFDKRTGSSAPGGTVWEHWCTTRDLRPSNRPGDSLLRGYLVLVSALGGLFVAAVARGRRSHEHPRQLCALVKAGVHTTQQATRDTTPMPIPKDVQKKLYEARPAEYLTAAEKLQWPPSRIPGYFMFARRISEWSPTAKVREDLARFNR
jgi:hypothetical protein